MTAALVFTPSIPAPATPATVSVAMSDARPVPRSREIYRRRRLVVCAAVVGLVLGVASFGRQADATPTPEVRAAQTVSIVVQPGDTLWGIAQSLDPDTDPRPLVAALSDLVGGGPLQPGQLLRVPGDLVG
jgi:nucleoid-associated protein YgaU